MEKKPLILIVDDEERNLRLLESILIPQKYEVTVARNGAEAISKAISEAPEVILLDVMMPLMDGFEACRRLKADERTAPIPVLLVTALESRADRMKGIGAGATDFISKPLDIDYLLLKVRNALYAKHLFNTVQESYDHQKRFEEVRDKLTRMIVHDLRTPLIGIIGNLELLKLKSAAARGSEEKEYLADALFAAQTMIDMTTSMLLVNRSEQGTVEISLNREDLKETAAEAIERLGSMQSQCRIIISCTPEPEVFPCDREVTGQLMLTLLSNAVKYTTSGDSIRIAIAAEPGGLRVTIADAGSKVPTEFHKIITEKFGAAAIGRERRMYSTGLGLVFCKIAAEAHGGDIGIEYAESSGNIFQYFLPSAKQAS
jgi:K+-sensing histidine kinase KdpD